MKNTEITTINFYALDAAMQVDADDEILSLDEQLTWLQRIEDAAENGEIEPCHLKRLMRHLIIRAYYSERE